MKLDEVGRALSDAARGRVESSFPLARFTTYRLGGSAALYAEPADLDDLVGIGAVLREADPDGAIPVLLVGRGSNMVISDAGWPGLALRLGQSFAGLEFDASRAGELVVGAGKALPLVANAAARRSLAGMEWAIGVPGSIGGAARMNAGAHGSDMAASLVGATVFDLASLEVAERSSSALDLTYRHSNLTDREVVTGVRLRLSHDDPDAIRERTESYRRHRAETQPGALQNAGSTFKNPEGDSAGRLVEAAGLKGFRVRGASVSTKHANFFMSTSSATSQDVFDLVNEVRARVEVRFGVSLEPEVRFVGPFASRPAGIGAR